jgi:pyridoxal phosphate enzyme (YggS family)
VPGRIADNLAKVRARIAAAAQRSGRDPGEVVLVVVTKQRALEEVQAAVSAGATDLGENYVQEMVQKASGLADDAVRWHAIGHLQRNKVRHIAPFVSLIHSLDSLRLAREVDSRAVACDRTQPVLLEVNVAGEGSKSGLDEEELFELAPQALSLPNLRLAGLMTMAPYSDDPEDSRPYYRRLRDLREQLIERGVPAENLRQLSMGMTSDFEVAVEEGATLVRVGTAIFGPRR